MTVVLCVRHRDGCNVNACHVNVFVFVDQQRHLSVCLLSQVPNDDHSTLSLPRFSAGVEYFDVDLQFERLVAALTDVGAGAGAGTRPLFALLQHPAGYIADVAALSASHLDVARELHRHAQSDSDSMPADDSAQDGDDEDTDYYEIYEEHKHEITPYFACSVLQDEINGTTPHSLSCLLFPWPLLRLSLIVSVAYLCVVL